MYSSPPPPAKYQINKGNQAWYYCEDWILISPLTRRQSLSSRDATWHGWGPLQGWWVQVYPTVSHRFHPGESHCNFILILRQDNLFSLTFPSQVAPHWCCTTLYVMVALRAFPPCSADRAPQEGLRAPTSTTRPRHPAAPRPRSVAGEASKRSPPAAALKMAPRRTQDGAGGQGGVGRWGVCVGGEGVVCGTHSRWLPARLNGRWRPPRRRGAARHASRHASRRDVPCVRGAR